MRLFTAIELDDVIKREFGSIINHVSGQIQGVKWVDARNMHLTLVFLGEQNERDAGVISECVRIAAEKSSAFDVEAGSVGVFPEKGMPRVIWAGLDDSSGKLCGLVNNMKAHFKEKNIAFDEKDFRAHITLGRVKDPSNIDPDNLKKTVSRYDGSVFGAIKCETIKLISSRLAPQGPEYSVVKEFKIGKL